MFESQLIRVQLADRSMIEFRHGSFFSVEEKKTKGMNDPFYEEIQLCQLDLAILKPKCREKDSNESLETGLRTPVFDSFRFILIYDGLTMETPSVDEVMKLIGGNGKMQPAARIKVMGFFVILKHWMLIERRYDVYHDDIEPDDSRIVINREVEDPRSVLTCLNDLSSIVTHPNAFAGLLSYMVVYPFSYELRQRGILTPIPLLEGKSQTGKTRMAELIVCRGFGQHDAFKTTQSVKTEYSKIRTMSEGRYPFIVDDIDMDFMQKFEGFMRSSISGTGESQRGNLTAKGIAQWHVRRLPVLTTNRIDEVHEEIANRFLQWRFGSSEAGRVDKRSYFSIVERLPEGWMFVFMRWFNGNTMGNMEKYLKDGYDTTGLKQRYLDYGYQIISETYEQYGLECKIPKPVLQELLTEEWNDIFLGWVQDIRTELNAGLYDDRHRKPFWLAEVEHDIEVTERGFRLSVKGFAEFRKKFKDCPYSARSFAERYGYEYRAVWICGQTVKGISGGTLD